MRRRRRANNELPEVSEKRIAKTMMRRNAMLIMECSTAWAFRWWRNSFFCSYCDDRFVDASPLREHVLSLHINEQPTKRIFAKLTENNMVKIDVGVLKCRLCGLSLDGVDSLKYHLSSHGKLFYADYSDGVLPFRLNDETGYSCQKCFQNFVNFSKLNEHMNTHYQNYICDSCGKAFVSKSRFRTHVQSHEKGSFPCGECEEVLETRAARVCHKFRVHKKGMRYVCPRCPEIFTTYLSRARHLVEFHAQRPKEYPWPNELKWKRKCRFQEDKANAAIIIECTNVTPFRWKRGRFLCAYCPFVCPNPTDVRTHSAEHERRLDVLTRGDVRNTFPVRVEISDLKCRLCQQKIENLDALKDHLINKHSKPLNPKYADGIIPFVLSDKTFKCVCCDKQFEVFVSLSNHMNGHYPSYICDSCGKGFAAKHKLRTHKITHDTGEYPCSKCDLVFTTRAFRNRHMVVAHGPKNRYRCPHCGLTFGKYSDRIRHMAKVHGKKLEYRCTICTSVFGVHAKTQEPIKNSAAADRLSKAMSRSRKLEEEKHNITTILECSNAVPFRCAKGKFICGVCPLEFTDVHQMRAHIGEHRSKIAALKHVRSNKLVKMEISHLKCEICDEAFDDFTLFKSHLVEEHAKRLYDKNGDGFIPFRLTDGYNCVICDESFQFFLMLNRHMNTHYVSHVCNVCGKGFLDRNRLITHMTTHDRGRFACKKCELVFDTVNHRHVHVVNVHRPKDRYKCPRCDHKFTSHNVRYRHLRDVHGENIRHRCPLCSATFNSSSSRSIHVRLVHAKKKEHCCSFCSARFGTSWLLKNHAVIHTGKKEFKCQVCKKAYARKKTLTEHMKIHNNDKRFGDSKVVSQLMWLGQVCLFDLALWKRINESRMTKGIYRANVSDGRVGKNPESISVEAEDWQIDDATSTTLDTFVSKTEVIEAKQYLDVILKYTTACLFRWSRGKYICYFCSQSYIEPQHLREHVLIQHSSLKQVKIQDKELVKMDFFNAVCKICCCPIDNVDLMENHLSKRHELRMKDIKDIRILPFKLIDKENVCQICGENCETFVSLNKHMNRHFQDFVCADCGKSFATSRRLRSHRTIHEDKDFCCSKCKDTFPSSTELYNHTTRVHRKNGRYKCPLCGEKFVSYSKRINHLNGVHNMKQIEFNCPSCPRTFRLCSLRNMHVRQSHLNERNHLCNFCGSKFPTKYRLSQHMLKHGGEKKYQCDVCKKFYVRMNTLREHMRIHNNDWRFKCDVCGQSFIQKCSLKQHFRRLHSEGPERMTELENLKRNGSGRTKRYKTKTKNNLLTVLEHTTACPFRWLHNTFMCFYCDTKFNDIISLKSHTMDNHPDTTETFNKFRWSYRHVKVEITDLKCKLCDSGFDDVKPAKEHLASDHEKRIDFAYSDALIPYKLLNSNSYTCHVCDKVYYRFAHLSNHLNDHYRNYVCDTCGAPFLERSRLRQHLLTHGGGSYPCVHCGEVFESVITKRHHMSRFHWKNGFRLACPHCPERFKAYRDRIHHMSVVHNVKNENCGCPFCILPAGPSKDDDSTKPYECSECHKRFTRKHELNSHRVSHTGERPYTCEVCLKSYGRKRTLREHMRIHNNDKRFACQECGRAFVQKCSLKSKETTGSIEKRMVPQETRPSQQAYSEEYVKLMNDIDEMIARKRSVFHILECSRVCPFKWAKNLYGCFFCDEHFNEPTWLREHNATNHSQTNGQQIRASIKKLKKYEMVKVDITDISCKLCDDAIKDFGTLKQHLLTVHNKLIDPKYGDGVLPFRLANGGFHCVLCDRKYEEFKLLNQHMNVHFQNFICEQCGAGFMTPERLKTHAFSHETGSFQCDACDKIFRSMNAKNEHYASVHKQVKRHRCTQCSETFRNYFQRNKHLNVVHGIKSKEFKCNLCDKVFTLSGKLGNHIKAVHLKEKRHACNICEWKFYAKSELKEHMIRHGGERKYQCGVCKKAYARKYTLREHMRIHNNDRRFICAVCGKAFVQNCSLKHHMKVHHPNPASAALNNLPVVVYHNPDTRSETSLKPETVQREEKIVPLFQVAYDRTLCRPLGTLVDFNRLTPKLKEFLKRIEVKDEYPTNVLHSPSRSVSPLSPLPSATVNGPVVKDATKSKPKSSAPKIPDLRQNALTVFEFSTVYPFVYGNNKFKCFICSQPFLETPPLKEHMNSTHTFAPLKRLINNRRETVIKVDVSSIICKICTTPFKDLTSLKVHLKDVHQKPLDAEVKDNMIPFKLDEGLYKCFLCDQVFIKVRLLVIHMSVHFSNYSCDVCGSGFMTLRLLKKHLEVHESGNFPCDRCEKVFNTSHKRSLHIRGVHLKQCPRRCPICPERFNSNYRRTIHLQDVHNQSTRVHKCDICGRGFNLKYHLISHTRAVHLQERNQQCKLCLQRFCSKETLKRHMVIHTGEKNYKCEVCGMAFLRRKNLKDHMRLHDVA
ncbi:Zinc finger protein 91 [Eumeta japonica]|uniref:Zinc finger protein 91 n=1 Tax=Eumeta variegata TaxID=151549 RepID=A0A4C1V441_EUMVA|nr:Zinc finger protein 91 [Eumeta japonica]